MLASRFDYKNVEKADREFVRQKTTEIHDRMGRAAQNIVEIGQRLIEVKERLNHGQFCNWLVAEFDWGERTARNMMNVAARFKTANFADLNVAPSALYLLASDSTPEDVRDKFIEQAKTEPVTHKAVKAAIADAKPVRCKARRADKVDAEPPAPTPSPAKPADDVDDFFDQPAPAETPAKPEPPQGDILSRAAELEELARRITAVRTEVTGKMTGDKPDILYRAINLTAFQAGCKNLTNMLRGAMPEAICPVCKGDKVMQPNCKLCKASGWVTGLELQAAPKVRRAG